MKKILILASLSLVFACGNDKKPTVKKETSTETNKVETININKENIEVNWTAYKFTERVGVSGTFKTVQIKDKMYGASFKDVLSNVNFTIPTKSVFSKNEIRDKKLYEVFFQSMNITEHIEGQITSVLGDDKKGTCKVMVKMNDISKSVNMEYHKKDNTYSLKGFIDMNDWKVEESVEKLNTACFELHKGKDGVSKLWPDVKLEIVLPLL